MAKGPRYWVANCAYEGHAAFHFFSNAFCVIAEHETVAAEELQQIVDRAWKKISPHPSPRLISVVPGCLVIDVETEYQRAPESEGCRG